MLPRYSTAEQTGSRAGDEGLSQSIPAHREEEKIFFLPELQRPGLAEEKDAEKSEEKIWV